MKVLVCGAGQVGFNIARHLAAENNDVSVIDRSPELIRTINDTLDATGFVGHASNPDNLEAAGIGDADMIIAVTYADEVNMVACQVAHSLFDVPTKIARVREQSYLNPAWSNLFSRDHLPIDVIISPEREVAHAVSRRLRVPGALEMIPLADDKVTLLGVRCTDKCPIINTPLRQLTHLFPDLEIAIMGLMRKGETLVPTGDDQMLEDDEVYFVASSDQIHRAMAAFGVDRQEARRMLIFGGGNIGKFLAHEIERDFAWVNAKIIEAGHDRARLLASELERTVVLNGDVLDPDLLTEAGIETTETVVAVTNDDETNILASLLAKRYGSQRVITLVNKPVYEDLIGTLGVDVVVNPRNITVSTILQHVRRGRIHSVHTLREGFGELIEAEALETSDLVGKPIREISIPHGVLFGAIVRDGEVIVPRGSTVIQAKDRVILFASTNAVRKVEQMFSVQLEFF